MVNSPPFPEKYPETRVTVTGTGTATAEMLVATTAAMTSHCLLTLLMVVSFLFSFLGRDYPDAFQTQHHLCQQFSASE
jgi:hypothetical protein